MGTTASTSYTNESFSPVRSNCSAKWFVDGESYMAAVADAIETAKSEIMITDWMLSAQIFLRRSTQGVTSFEDSSRLDKMLLKKADEGVKVFLLIWHGEIKIPGLNSFLDLGHKHSKELLSHHENIVFILDPVIWKSWWQWPPLSDWWAGHLTYLWSHHEKLVIVDQTLAFVGGIDLCYGRWDNHQHHLMDNNKKPLKDEDSDDIDSDVQFQTWVGLDYMNGFIDEYEHDQFQTPFTDYINRSKDPRLPWHDIACCIQGEAVKDVVEHFRQRYDLSSQNKKGLAPGNFVNSPSLTITDPSTSNCSCQILRSASNWSVGRETEHSIQNAYISAIENAEHFVYIENQFFISSVESLDVTNGIAKAIKDRIARAYKEKKKFRVILVIPLKPEFKGDISDSSNAGFINMIKDLPSAGEIGLQEILHAELLTISQKECSIFQKLTKDGIPEKEIPDYFSVYGLRTYDYKDNGIPVTEIVYVHTKCMIVDDRVTIIGSANINERSMKGDRDSEVVVCFQDETFVDSYMNGVPYKAGEFAQSLRLHLFREHMGIDDNDLILDPLSENFYKAWMDKASVNNEIFKEVFGGDIVPCDGVKTYKQLNEHQEKRGLAMTDIDKAKHELEKIKGNLVKFPLDFLANEDEWNSLPGIFRKKISNPVFFARTRN